MSDDLESADVTAVSAEFESLGSRCVKCHEPIQGEPAQRREWGLVCALQRMQKKVRCTGSPLGWTLVVNGVRTEEIARFQTVLCTPCRDALTIAAEEEAARFNAKEAKDRKLFLWIIGVIGLALVPLTVTTAVMNARSPLTGNWEIAKVLVYVIQGIAAFVWLIIFAIRTDRTAEEVRTEQVSQLHQASITSVLNAHGVNGEVVAGDEPTDLERSHYVVTPEVIVAGAASGWTLFRCIGIFDQPGGARTEVKTTAWIRDNNIVHTQDLGAWLTTASY